MKKNIQPMNTSPTIQSIEAVLVDLPTIRAHKLAMTTMMRQTLVIVRLVCSDGLTGIGEATTIGGLAYGDQSPESIKSAIDNYLAPLLIGTDATGVNVAMQRVSASVQGNSFAKSAVEIALLDAQGQRLGLPVHALLGGAMRDALPVLWTLASGDATRDVDEALALIEARRHKVFKLKIGSHPLAQDIAHVQAIRRGLGEDVMLTVDVNQAWDETTAVQGIAALESLGVSLIEQPVARRNRRALKRLAARFDVAIMADEAVHDAIDAFDLAADGAADVYALKISQAGGLWPTLQGRSHRRRRRRRHLRRHPAGRKHRQHCSGPCLRRLPEAGLGHRTVRTRCCSRTTSSSSAPDYRDFELQLPQAPGLGVQLDLDKLAFYRRDRASQAVAVTA